MKLNARTKLRVGIGLAALVVVLLVLAAALLTVLGNNRKFEGLQKRAQTLARHAREGVKNASHAQSKKDLRMAYTKQLDQVKEELIARDALIEQPFKDEVNNIDPPLEYGTWKRVYEKNMADLLKALRDSVISADAQPLVSIHLDEIWKPTEWMRQHEKAYWIQKAVVDAIAKVNATQKVVPVFGSFVFTNVPEHFMQSSHESDQFDCIPFSIQVQMEFVRIPELLQALLDSDLGPEITSVSILTQGSTGFAVRSAATATRTTRTSTARRGRPSSAKFGGTSAAQMREFRKQEREEAEEGDMARYGLSAVPMQSPGVSSSTSTQTQPQSRRQTPRTRLSGYSAPTAAQIQRFRKESREEEDAESLGAMYVPATPARPQRGGTARGQGSTRQPGSTRRVRPARRSPSLTDVLEAERELRTQEDVLAQGPTVDWMRIGPISRTQSVAPAQAPQKVAVAPNLVEEAREYMGIVQETKEAIPQHTVNVIVNGYVPDYIQPEEETAEEDEIIAPGE